MTSAGMDRPCIHVSLFPDADASLYRWVEIGAEEEGVPTRMVPGEGSDLASFAYHTAQSSRLSIGVTISAQAIALHEQHMPVGQPVLVFKFSSVEGQPNSQQYLCRLMGANAARMVVHRPLHIDINFPPPSVKRQPPAVVPKLAPEKAPAAAEPEIDPVQLAKIIAMVIQKLQERGM
jgi:hypothetical protein